MNTLYFKKTFTTMMLVIVVCMCSIGHAVAQKQGVIINMAMLEGIDLTPANVFGYQLINNTGSSKDVDVKATIVYRQGNIRASYNYTAQLQPGSNQMSKDRVGNANWSFSDNAFHDLFLNYGKMPQGTYEYCVSAVVRNTGVESQYSEPSEECVYQNVNDLFLINLIDPENDAKLYEPYPVLSWVVNYPMVSELTYRIRVAELKKGQNNENAIARNNPVFQESNLTGTSIIYPATAKPLVKFQPYVWTVDAYYHGLLLGGAEVWKFTIVEDPLMKEVQIDQSYFDFASHIGESRLNVAGEMKLRYNTDNMSDTLSLEIMDEKNTVLSFPNARVPLVNGENWIIIPLHEKVAVKHKKRYTMRITTPLNKKYEIPFFYLNPLLLNEQK